MSRIVVFLLCTWSLLVFPKWLQAQVTNPDVQPAPLVRLTGVLETVENPPPSSFPKLRVWFGDKSRMFHVSKVEPVMPAYLVKEQLRKAPSLGLRLVAEGEALAQLENADANNRPITIEGWLRPHAGLLRVKSVQVAQEEDGRLNDGSP
ncbi:MAG: hypothetical protein HY267_04125 [Deltaproteobacteria bacterium]|nr:hypothetical protein [Deltaproteobacteria bacterium]